MPLGCVIGAIRTVFSCTDPNGTLQSLMLRGPALSTLCEVLLLREFAILHNSSALHESLTLRELLLQQPLLQKLPLNSCYNNPSCGNTFCYGICEQPVPRGLLLLAAATRLLLEHLTLQQPRPSCCVLQQNLVLRQLLFPVMATAHAMGQCLLARRTQTTWRSGPWNFSVRSRSLMTDH